MVTNRRNDYGGEGWQAEKGFSIAESKKLVSDVRGLLAPALKTCEPYEPGPDLRIGGAPAVKLPDGQLAIAPDLKCETGNGKTFWVEVKDKAQRFFHPDTGADLHQVLGWYDILKHFAEDTLVIFRDPPLENCLPRGTVEDRRLEAFKLRWGRFSGGFYGNWLTNCLGDDGEYPKVLPERSRNFMRHIFYFRVTRLVSLDLTALIKELEEKATVAPALIAYSNTGARLTEPEIRRLV